MPLGRPDKADSGILDEIRLDCRRAKAFPPLDAVLVLWVIQLVKFVLGHVYLL